jgi:hypothetical protein
MAGSALNAEMPGSFAKMLKLARKKLMMRETIELI